MRKLLLMDETAGAADAIEEILNIEWECKVIRAVGKFETENVILKENPALVIVNSDLPDCMKYAENLLGNKKFSVKYVFIGKNVKQSKAVLKKFFPLAEIDLPFDINDFREKIDEAFLYTEGQVDEITGLYKKRGFDYKLKKQLDKKKSGTFFCMTLDAYSFAENSAPPYQLQLAIFAMKSKLEGAIIGADANVITGFIPSEKPREEMLALLDDTIKTMREAAGEPEIFISAGVSDTQTEGFNAEDLLLYADKALAVSKDYGKNNVKYYR